MKKNKYFILRKKRKEQNYYEVNKKQQILPYNRIYPNGYFEKEGIYSAMIELRLVESKEENMIRELRNSEFDFRIFNRNEKRYLIIYEKCNDYKFFEDTMQTVVERLKTAGETYGILTANERIRFLHEGYLIFRTKKSLNISDYLNNMEECAADFQNNRKEDMKPQMTEENGYYVLAGIHSFPDKTEQITKCVTRLVKDPATSSVRIFETVKDEIVRHKIRELYMGFEGELVKMKRTDREFYDWYMNQEEESARYTFSGCLVCVYGTEEEELQRTIEKMQKDVKENDGRIAIYAAGKKKVLEQILGVGTEEGFTRMLLTEKIGGMVAGTMERTNTVPVLAKNII